MLKEKIILLFIKIIDFIVNNDRLIQILNYISEKALKIILFGFNLKQSEDSIFKGMRVAFIADGNRRWYKKELLNNKRELGDDKNKMKEHSSIQQTDNHFKKVKKGVKKIEEIVKFAYFYNLKEVSFYCFSIKNFKREKNEIDEIMNYIKKYKIFEYDIPIKIKIYGRMELLEEGVRKAFEQYEKETENRKGLTVNLFFSYSSTDEQSRINEQINNDKFFDGKVDLLIRTSGEKRLSDFMVKQVASGTAVDFVRPMWPEFSLIHLFLVLLKYKLEEAILKKDE